MKRSRLPALAPILGLVALAFWTPGTLRDATLDRLEGYYFEDNGSGRRLARLDARLVRDQAAARLELTISSLGPLVEAAPGWEGRHGGNRITAREMSFIIERKLGEVSTREVTALDQRGSVRRAKPSGYEGRLEAGRRGRVPERRLVDGKLVFDGWSERTYILELEARSAPLGVGTHSTEIIIAGVPRLRVTTRLERTPDGLHGTVLELGSLGGQEIDR